MRLIGHIDADSFYVACERVRSANLTDKPVCVLSNQGAIVIARSYEAKKLGIKVGTPVWEAKKVYPEVVYIKRDFQWYAVLSAAMQEVLHGFSDTIEYYSIDESFVDFGDYTGNAFALAAEIQNVMMKKTGLPVSVGISLSKTLAKIASDKDKPLGTRVVLPEGLESFLKETDVSEISGIGFKLEQRLRQNGVNSAFEYVSKDSEFIRRVLHKPGECLWYELKGHSIMPVRTERPRRKGISRGGSLQGHRTDKKIIWAFIVRNLERFIDALLKQEIEIKKVILLLITDSGAYLKDEFVLPDYSNSFMLVVAELRRSFERIFCRGYSYSATHILGDDIRDIGLKQLSLFEVEDSKARKIMQIKKTVNKKFGLFAVRSAETAYINEIFRDEASTFEVSDMDKKFCF